MDTMTTVIAPFGDLKLVIGSDSGSKEYLVSSVVLCLASLVWNAMFGLEGRFKKAKVSKSSGVREVRFEDDDADALLLVLRIAHLKFSNLPATLNYKELLSLAIICDKYDLVHLVRPWLYKWEKTLKPSSNSHGNEGWLFIAWTFGDTPSYKALTDLLVRHCTTVNTGECFRSGRLIVGDHIPPGSIDAILKARESVLTALLDMCRDLVDLYLSEGPVCGGWTLDSTLINDVSHNAKVCDNLNQGCLIRSLNRLKLWPVPVSVGDVDKSVHSLMKELRSMECCYLVIGDTDHRECKFSSKIEERINRIEGDTSLSVMDESHLQHMQEQAKK